MRICPAILFLMMITATVTLAQEATWLPRYDANNSGVTAATIGLPAALAWKYVPENAATEDPVATPAVGEEMIYVPVGDTIYALDRVTGSLVWEQSAGDVIYSSPALAGGILYFGSRDNNLWAVDASDGSVEWRYPTGGSVDCPPTIVGNICYFGSDDNRLTALNLETQQPLWTFEASGDIKAPPLVYRDVIVIGSMDGRLYCLNSSGRPIWSNSIDAGTFVASPVGERTKVIYASGRDLNARDLYSGRLGVWRRPFRAADLIVGSPCVLGREVYIATRDGSVYSIDANSGNPLWRWPAEGAADPITSSPVIAGDKLVFRAGERDLIAISLDGRRMLWKYTLPQVEERAQEAAGLPGDVFMGDPGMMPEEMPAEEPIGVDEPGGTTTRPARRVEFEELVSPSVAVVNDAVYVIGDDAIAYGFHSDAPDNVPPTIAEPVLEVPGAGRQRVEFTPSLADAEEFAERFADEIAIPGTPPIFLSLLLVDEGSGVDPDSVSVTVNGEAAGFTYDPREGLIWYIYEPRGAAANLANGVKRIMFEASDWRGNRQTKVVSFTVDNKLKPPAPPRPPAPTFDPGMFPGEDMPPGAFMP